MASIKFYLHNSNQKNEIEELIADADTGLSTEAQEKLAEEIYSRFYEVAFDVEFNPNGSIRRVTTNEHGK